MNTEHALEHVLTHVLDVLKLCYGIMALLLDQLHHCSTVLIDRKYFVLCSHVCSIVES